MPAARALLAVVALAVALAACETGGPADDAGPACGTGLFSVGVDIGYVDRIDLVVVVDGAGLDVLRRDAYADGITDGVRTLLSGDIDGDGAVDSDAFRRVRVAVVSADAGDDGQGLAGCTPNGRDGRFVSCGGGTTAWTEVGEGLDTAFGLEAIACAVRAAAETSCGRARPLDAARLALLPAASGAVPGRTPHGDAEHAGFSRRLALLALVFLAPHDDCSGGAVPDGSLSTEARCLGGASRADVAAAAAELGALRENPALVVAAVLGGYPATARWDGLAALAGVAPVVRPDGTIAPACDGPLLSASPAPRLAGFLDALERRGVGAGAHPLCTEGRAWVTQLVGLPVVVDGHSCLPRALPRDERGLVDCELRLTLPPTVDRDRWADCAALGATSLGPAPDDPDRELCLVPQLASPAELGAGLAFAYDDGPATMATCGAWYPPGQTLRLSLDGGRDIDSGSRLDLVCRFFDPADAGVARCE